MDQTSPRQFRFFGGRNYPLKAIIILFVTAFFFIVFQVNVLSDLQEPPQTAFLHTEEEKPREKRSKQAAAAAAAAAKQIAIAVPGPDLRINPKFASAFRDEIGIKVNGTILRGVMKEHRKYYLPSKDGTFACLNGNQTVPWRAVNNDHCDCADGSDEPGTSACKNGKFYCEPEFQFISSQRVNDGWCDCCDGSDEWKGVTLPPEELPKDKEGARRAPCFDVCMDYEHSKLREENILKEGAALKQKYLELGGEHIGDGNYGPQGEFYILSQQCYKFRSPSYVYDICPYVNATQNGKDVWIIGRGGRLEGSLQDGFKLIMENGDGNHCPDGKKRKTIMNLRCAVSDQLSFVSEKDTCVYVAKFNTPAACSSLLDGLKET